MGIAVSLKRNRKTQPVHNNSERSTKSLEKYHQRKLTTLRNPFQFSVRRPALPDSLQHFTKQPPDVKNKLAFFSDNTNYVKLQADELCFICNVYSTSTDVFTCRVCMKVFHEGCLQKIGSLSSEVSSYHANAISKSIIGWSCYKCSNLSLLLMEDEMHEIMELFDDYDTNQDTQISLEEYLKFKEKQYTSKTREPFSNYLSTLAKEEFNMIDRDRTGTIDWWEFLNHESVKMLMKRDKIQLVEILSAKEVADAKEKFNALDVDNDGKITAFEAEKVYSDWFSKLSGPKDNKSRSEKKSQGSSTADHAYNHTMLVMEADSDRNKYVDWNEYLENEAIFIIATRPNIPMPALSKNEDKTAKHKPQASKTPH